MSLFFFSFADKSLCLMGKCIRMEEPMPTTMEPVEPQFHYPPLPDDVPLIKLPDHFRPLLAHSKQVRVHLLYAYLKQPLFVESSTSCSFFSANYNITLRRHSLNLFRVFLLCLCVTPGNGKSQIPDPTSNAYAYKE